MSQTRFALRLLNVMRTKSSCRPEVSNFWRRPPGRLLPCFTRLVVPSERFFVCLAFNALIKRFGNRYIGFLTAVTTHLRRSRSGLRLTTRSKTNGEWSWLNTVMGIKTKLILAIKFFGQHGACPSTYWET